MIEPTSKKLKNQETRIEDCIRVTNCNDFSALLSELKLDDVVKSECPDYRERLYPPATILSLFVSQVLSSDGSCQNTVNHYVVARIHNGVEPCSTGTGAYCKARNNLPLKMVNSMAKQAGAIIMEQQLDAWCWQERRVKLVDGTTVTMPDTPENQSVYPQQKAQEPGLGFPIARMVGLICLGTGAILDASMGPYKGKGSGEHGLFRQLLGSLNSGDIVLADRYYCSYWLIAQLLSMGVDVLFGQNSGRKTDFRRGKQLGTRDHIVEWPKPRKRPDWMTKEQYQNFPATLNIRETKSGGTVLVTTLLSPKYVSKSELSSLYKQRWNVELDLRNIKTTLGMDTLRCITPNMNEKEVWVYFLAYNLIRFLMCQAAAHAHISPRQISFKHSLQMWNAWSYHSLVSQHHEKTILLFTLIAQQLVANRPGRIEPRAIKKRPKMYPKLRKPRLQARNDIRKHGHPKRLK